MIISVINFKKNRAKVALLALTNDTHANEVCPKCCAGFSQNFQVPYLFEYMPNAQNFC